MSIVLQARVSIITRCLDEEYYGGYSHDSKVVLEVRLEDYHILAKILCKNISFIYKSAIGDVMKNELLRDARTIRTILEKSEKEVVK